MKREGRPREKVLATIVSLLEKTLIRVGNAEYVSQNKSYGLRTMRRKHVDIKGGTLRFEFTGKSGKQWKLRVGDKRIVAITKRCADIRGHELFKYLDDQGEVRLFIRLRRTDQDESQPCSCARLRETHGVSVREMLITSLGLLAAALTSLSYIPQVRKALPRGSIHDLSVKTLIILAAGLGFWILYGMLKGDWVIVIANSFGCTLVVILLAFKFRDMR
jgi:uncharacterized protein with PQ loop repeat